MADKWISGAIKHPGALKRAAKRSGESMSEYCDSPPNTKAKRRCALRKTLRGFSRGR